MVEAISGEVDEPVIVIANLYRVERTQLEEHAKIPTLILVIASRQVRIKLKRLEAFRQRYRQRVAIESSEE